MGVVPSPRHPVLLSPPMCGRFTQTASPAVIAQEFGVTVPPLFTPRYNIAPSQPVAAIRIEPGTMTRALVQLRWGLIPSWAKDPKIGHQCQGRDRGGETLVPCRLQGPALPGDCDGVL